MAGVAQPPRFVERVLELDDGAVTCWGRNHPRWGSRSTYLGSMTPVTGDLVVYHAQSSPKGPAAAVLGPVPGLFPLRDRPREL